MLPLYLFFKCKTNAYVALVNAVAVVWSVFAY